MVSTTTTTKYYPAQWFSTLIIRINVF